MKEINKNEVYNIVYNFKTNSDKGFTGIELEILLNQFDIDTKKVNNQLRGITAIKINNQIVYYKHDIYDAILVALGLSNRKYLL